MQWYESIFSSTKDLFHYDLWFTVEQYSIVIVLLQSVITLKNSVVFDGMVSHKPLAESFLSSDIIFLERTDSSPLVPLQTAGLLVTFGSQDTKFL